jgi:hypothetical protein
MKALPTHTSLNSFIIQPESYGATVDEGFIVGGPVGDFELLLCHGTVCVVGKMRDPDPSTQQKFDLFIDGRLLFAKLNMLWWLYWSSIAAIDPDFAAEVM